MEVPRPVVWRKSGVRVVKVTRRQREGLLVEAHVNALAWACPSSSAGRQLLPSLRMMVVVFEPSELEAVHSAPVSSSSGVTRTLRVLTAVCGSGFHSVA